VIDRLVSGRRNWLRLPEMRPGLGPVVDEVARRVASGEVLVHGSNRRDIELFEPREQTTYVGQATRAVFASTEPVWSLFFAVTDTATVSSRWNACVLPDTSGAGRTRFFFSVGCPPDRAWTDGALYLLPRDTFVPSDDPAEWLSFEPVRPLEVIPVTPADFPFRDRVFGHREDEPEWRLELRLLANCLRSRPHDAAQRSAGS